MKSYFDHPRARHCMFVATIELTDTQSEARIQERTSDLSSCGCRVEARKPFPIGAKVSIGIAHRSANAFTRIEPKDHLILERWVEELRDDRECASLAGELAEAAC
jgi:hypothetical protein